jgi:hypothetical protein
MQTNPRLLANNVIWRYGGKEMKQNKSKYIVKANILEKNTKIIQIRTPKCETQPRLDMNKPRPQTC